MLFSGQKPRGCAITVNIKKNKEKSTDVDNEEFDCPDSNETEMLDDKDKEIDDNNQDEILVRPPVPKSNTDTDNTMFTHPVNMKGKDANIWPIEVEK